MTWFCVGALVVALLLAVFYRKAGPNGALIVSGRKGSYIDPATGERVEKSFRVYGVADLKKALALGEGTSTSDHEALPEEGRSQPLSAPSSSVGHWLDKADVAEEAASLVEDVTADL